MKKQNNLLLQGAISHLTKLEDEVIRLHNLYEIDVTKLTALGLKMIKVTETVKITRTIEIEMNDEVLLDGVRSVLNLSDNDTIVSMKYKIPSGGDYSGMSIDVDALTLTITIQSIRTS